MGYCLYCFEPIQLPITWLNIVRVDKYPLLCQLCQQRLEFNKGNSCFICSKASNFDYCFDCLKWKSYYHENDPLKKNISIFVYNEFMQELMTKWKYRGDYVLGYIFSAYVQQYFNHYYAYMNNEVVVMPIPLTSDRLASRSFNQAEMLVSFLKGVKTEQMKRVINEKQSKKSKKERMMTENPFKLLKSLNKSVVLVDDIYTTGRTLRHAAQLLKENGCPDVYALTLCRA